MCSGAHATGVRQQPVLLQLNISKYFMLAHACGVCFIGQQPVLLQLNISKYFMLAHAHGVSFIGFYGFFPTNIYSPHNSVSVNL